MAGNHESFINNGTLKGVCAHPGPDQIHRFIRKKDGLNMSKEIVIIDVTNSIPKNTQGLIKVK